MNKRTKTALYLLLALSACLFIWRFKSNYSRLMAEGETKTDNDLINVKLPDYQKTAPPARTDPVLASRQPPPSRSFRRTTRPRRAR